MENEGPMKIPVPTPPLVQATVNDQKLMEATPTSVAWTRVLCTRRNLRDTRVDMVYCSEHQEAKHATDALLADSAAWTQNRNIVLLTTKRSGGTHGTQENELKNGPPKSTVQKLTEPTPSVAWP